MPYCQSIRHQPLERFNLSRSVWRYVEFRKFEDMIRRKCLFFTRLRHIVDREIAPFEGAFSQANFEEPDRNVRYMLQDVLSIKVIRGNHRLEGDGNGAVELAGLAGTEHGEGRLSRGRHGPSAVSLLFEHRRQVWATRGTLSHSLDRLNGTCPT